MCTNWRKYHWIYICIALYRIEQHLNMGFSWKCHEKYRERLNILDLQTLWQRRNFHCARQTRALSKDSSLIRRFDDHYHNRFIFVFPMKASKVWKSYTKITNCPWYAKCILDFNVNIKVVNPPTVSNAFFSISSCLKARTPTNHTMTFTQSRDRPKRNVWNKSVVDFLP